MVERLSYMVLLATWDVVAEIGGFVLRHGAGNRKSIGSSGSDRGHARDFGEPYNNTESWASLVGRTNGLKPVCGVNGWWQETECPNERRGHILRDPMDDIVCTWTTTDGKNSFHREYVWVGRGSGRAARGASDPRRSTVSGLDLGVAGLDSGYGLFALPVAGK